MILHAATVGKNPATHFFGEKQTFPENMRSTARLQSKPILCLNSPLIIHEAQQRNCLSSSCSLGKCNTARFSSRLPLFQARQRRGPLPVPLTPVWGWEPPTGPGFAELALWSNATLQFPAESCCSLQCHYRKSPFLQPRGGARVGKALKNLPFSQENLK